MSKNEKSFWILETDKVISVEEEKPKDYDGKLIEIKASHKYEALEKARKLLTKKD